MSEYKQMENEEANDRAVTSVPMPSSPPAPPAYFYNPIHQQYPAGQVPVMMNQPVPSTNMTSTVHIGGDKPGCHCCCCSCPNWVCCLIVIFFVLVGIGGMIGGTAGRH